MLESVLACIDILHIGYRVKGEYDPAILNVYHCLCVEDKLDDRYLLHIDEILKKSVHVYTESEIYTYLTYVFEKDQFVPGFLKSVLESGIFKEVLLRFVELKQDDSLQCVKIKRDLSSKWHYSPIGEEVAQNLTISASGRVFLTRYITQTSGPVALKTEQGRICENDAYMLLEKLSLIDLESKDVEENGWILQMYKSMSGKNRLVKTIVHDDKDPNGINALIRKALPFDDLFVFGGSYHSWEKM